MMKVKRFVRPRGDGGGDVGGLRLAGCGNSLQGELGKLKGENETLKGEYVHGFCFGFWFWPGFWRAGHTVYDLKYGK
ncbi:MAG: hypothetical protein LBB83_00185 [Treponema sp.]|nr:hypothetical protein [Treponema sp.]